MILAGDVGGTKIALGLFAPEGGAMRTVRTDIFASADHDDLGEVIASFLARSGVTGEGLAAACVGVAGPVIDHTTRTPNLAWEIDSVRVAAQVRIPRVWLINDLVATAEGIESLAADELFTLQAGQPNPLGNRALIAAGTGLGMALIPRLGGELCPVATEGGHQDFAARNPEELALLDFLRRRHGGHVSVERVASGPGLEAIYDHLVERREIPQDPLLRDRMQRTDPSRAIAHAALVEGDPLAAHALDLFTAAYGAAAGDLALIGLSTAGLYVGGGIAPKILDKLRGGTFLTAFRDKGRFAELMAHIPVHVILQPETALRGAARVAARRLAAG